MEVHSGLAGRGELTIVVWVRVSSWMVVHHLECTAHCCSKEGDVLPLLHSRGE